MARLANLSADIRGKAERVFDRVSRRAAYLSPLGYSLGPRWIVLTINNVCNLHCKMCDVGTETTDTSFYRNLMAGSGNMSLELYDQILDNARSFPVRPGISFAYTEPGIHPNIVEMVRRGKAGGFKVSVITNGYTLPKLADPFVQSGLDWLYVSVDGPKAIHDEVRGSHRSFDRIVEGLRAVRDARRQRGSSGPEVHVSFVYTQESYRSLPELIDQLAPLEPAHLHATLLNFVHPGVVEAHNREFGGSFPATVTNLSQVDLAAFDLGVLARELERARSRARDAGITLHLGPDLRTEEELRRYFFEPMDRAAGELCEDPWNSVLIQSNGDVIPAHGRCFNVVVGNLKDASLGALFNGPKMVELRRSLKSADGLLPACTRCCGCFGRTATPADRRAFAVQRAFGRVVGASPETTASASRRPLNVLPPDA